MGKGHEKSSQKKDKEKYKCLVDILKSLSTVATNKTGGH